MILMHTWKTDEYASLTKLRKIADKYPNVRFIAGHSYHSDWDEAACATNDIPHFYLELTAVLDEISVLVKLVNGAGSEKILFGTDFPWFSYHYYIGMMLAADITDDDRRNIFYRNAQNLFGI